MELDVKNKLEEGLTFKVSRFKEVIKKTRPHKHDAYFELVFLSEGQSPETPPPQSNENPPPRSKTPTQNMHRAYGAVSS